ncbi:MAG: hypothetical protein ACK41P_01290, partial [Asticcacaulis sp.]
SWTVANARVGLRVPFSWEVTAYVNNLFDERAYLGLDRERGGEGRVGYTVNQPRTLGVNLRKEF